MLYQFKLHNKDDTMGEEYFNIILVLHGKERY